jgi:hypothetical protein
MAVGDFDLIGRGARILQTEPEPGWDAIARRVIAAVRAAPRGGWPLDIDDPQPGTAPGRLRISDLVLGTALSRALAGDPDYAVTDIEIHAESAALQDITVHISGRYRADLHVASDRVAAVCEGVITELVGARPGLPIQVVVDDVHS